MSSGFLGLVQNENMKIYRRLRTWILAAILLVIIIATAAIEQAVLPNVGADEWQDKAQQEIQDNEKQAKDAPNDDAASYYIQQNQELQYDLDNDINPYKENNCSFVDDAAEMIMIITLFVVIVASDIVAGEFTWGTIKMLMVRPHPRWSILLSKYVASIIFAVLLMLFLFVLSWLVGGIFFGFGGLDFANSSMGDQGEMVKQIASVHALQEYGLHFLTIIMVMTIAFMISTIFRTSGLAIGISIFVMFANDIISGVLAQYEWTKYLVFPNISLTPYLDNPNGMMEGMSLAFSLWIDAGYWAIFLIITWWIFSRRDIST